MPSPHLPNEQPLTLWPRRDLIRDLVPLFFCRRISSIVEMSQSELNHPIQNPSSPCTTGANSLRRNKPSTLLLIPGTLPAFSILDNKHVAHFPIIESNKCHHLKFGVWFRHKNLFLVPSEHYINLC